MTAFEITTHDGTATEVVDGCEYFLIEDGWVFFKDPNHKCLAAYPEPTIARIKRAA